MANRDWFKELLEITDRLHGPNGCPWDREQTFASLKPYILEEAHEALDAIDEGDDQKILEELGDLFYTTIFYAKVADKEGRFSIDDLLEKLCTKLVRRHPHVFGKEEAKSVEDVKQHWERIKKEEGKNREEKSALDSIPKTLPSLARGQKILKRMQKSQYPFVPSSSSGEQKEQNESALAARLLDLVCEATEADIDLEQAFRTLLKEQEEHFRSWERKN